ncbi:hypothetical protein CSKR_114008 [Clonorchis sinensis]|uniref:Uncharacterized protein n=1 Tax=Clonorchis sinensis TaxID=79923 RepID=A0A419Q5E3_CLOSI|nr:hypothetical protein CSKR_114008 [Clonorchis sinensis]
MSTPPDTLRHWDKKVTAREPLANCPRHSDLGAKNITLLGKRLFGVRITPRYTTEHSFSNCLVEDLPGLVYIFCGSETTVVEDMKTSQFAARVGHVSQPYNNRTGYVALPLLVSQIIKRGPSPKDLRIKFTVTLQPERIQVRYVKRLATSSASPSAARHRNDFIAEWLPLQLLGRVIAGQIACGSSPTLFFYFSCPRLSNLPRYEPVCFFWVAR